MDDIMKNVRMKEDGEESNDGSRPSSSESSISTQTESSGGSIRVDAFGRVLSGKYKTFRYADILAEYAMQAHMLQTPVEEEEEIDEEFDLGDGLDAEALNGLKKLFEEATDGKPDKGLDKKAFRQVLKKAIGGKISATELDRIFMKVDSDCSGTISFDEFLSYILVEIQGKQKMYEIKNAKPFDDSRCKDVRLPHRDNLQKICFNETRPEGHAGTIDYKHGKYCTVSKNGNLALWNLDLTVARTGKMENKGYTDIWVTDMVVLSNVNHVCISTTKPQLHFYDFTGGTFEKHFVMNGLPDAIMTLYFYYDFDDMDKAVLIAGDMSGSVYVFHFTEIVRQNIFPSLHAGMHINTDIEFSDILYRKYTAIEVTVYEGRHNGWVNTVRYLPELKAVISTSEDPKHSMFLAEQTLRKEELFYSTFKGILCAAYCPSNNLIITGGMDHTVRLWSPYANLRASAILTGHNMAVIRVAVDSQKDQIISIAKDKTLRIFDTKNHGCLQTMLPATKADMHNIEAVFYNPDLQQLLLGANRMLMFEHSKNDAIPVEERTTHEGAVTEVLFNEVFGYVVTTSVSAEVIVWHLNSGKQTVFFSEAHAVHKHGVDIPVPIMAADFDPEGRKLATCGLDGKVKLWNFNNGEMLREINHGGEVTSVIALDIKYVSAGGPFQLMQTNDLPDEKGIRRFDIKHTDDVLSLALYDLYVVSGSYNGDMYLWMADTGNVANHFNASLSTKSCMTTATPAKKERQNSEVTSTASGGQNSESNRPSLGSRMPTLSKVYLKRDSQAFSNKLSQKELSQLLLNPKKGKEGSHQRLTTPKHKPNLHSVDKLVALTTRPLRVDSAQLLASGAEGWVRAWSVHQYGGLVGQFNAAHQPGEAVLAMATSSDDSVLVTGDTGGYIKVWDISNYCTGIKQKSSLHQQRRADYNDFPFLEKSGGPAFIRECHSMPEAVTEPRRTLQFPPLLSSFRGHISSITAVCYVGPRDLIVSGGGDGNVRVWSLYGRYVGQFGSGLWSVNDLEDEKSQPRHFPGELKRTGSASTLRVLQGGISKLWRKALLLVKRQVWKDQKQRTLDLLEGKHQLRKEHTKVKGAPRLGKVFHTPQPMIHARMFGMTPRQLGIRVFNALSTHAIQEVASPEPPPIVKEIMRRAKSLPPIQVSRKATRTTSKHLSRLRASRAGTQSRASEMMEPPLSLSRGGTNLSVSGAIREGSESRRVSAVKGRSSRATRKPSSVSHSMPALYSVHGEAEVTEG